MSLLCSVSPWDFTLAAERRWGGDATVVRFFVQPGWSFSVFPVVPPPPCNRTDLLERTEDLTPKGCVNFLCDLPSVQANSSMFFLYNTNLVPPYQVIVDTNFVNAAVQIKTDVIKGLMDCLVAKCIPCITDCAVAELEKLGHRYRLALALAKDRRFKRLTCCHPGTYADDCIVRRVTEHKCYLVATNDRDLKRRIRKIPGVPIIYVKNHKFAVERLPDAIASVPSASK
ncbi:UNVERIFIED_CONTAM: rRNA-processing protein FCF1, putative [Hammondia hammondi]|eukprot:XP_008885170.1 rRNA-processing protein FCF1, putative [Hammondia hammondi]